MEIINTAIYIIIINLVSLSAANSFQFYINKVRLRPDAKHHHDHCNCSSSKSETRKLHNQNAHFLKATETEKSEEPHSYNIADSIDSSDVAHLDANSYRVNQSPYHNLNNPYGSDYSLNLHPKFPFTLDQILKNANKNSYHITDDGVYNKNKTILYPKSVHKPHYHEDKLTYIVKKSPHNIGDSANIVKDSIYNEESETYIINKEVKEVPRNEGRKENTFSNKDNLPLQENIENAPNIAKNPPETENYTPYSQYKVHDSQKNRAAGGSKGNFNTRNGCRLGTIDYEGVCIPCRDYASAKVNACSIGKFKTQCPLLSMSQCSPTYSRIPAMGRNGFHMRKTIF